MSENRAKQIMLIFGLGFLAAFFHELIDKNDLTSAIFCLAGILNFYFLFKNPGFLLAKNLKELESAYVGTEDKKYLNTSLVLLAIAYFSFNFLRH